MLNKECSMPAQMFIINKINILCIDKYQKKSFHYDIDHVLKALLNPLSE